MSRKSTQSIPVNTMTDDFGGAISIERLVVNDLRHLEWADLTDFEEGANQSHRHDSHSFFLLESGTVHLEIDFQTHEMKAPAVIYIHPDQVHRTTVSKDVIVSSWAINHENLHPDYLKLLEDITPAQPLVLNSETFSLMAEAVSLCLKFSERRDDRLYQSILRDGCHALVALVLSQYAAYAKPTDKLSRFDTITKAFRTQLERHYTTAKRPAAYAQKLAISTPYLNECVKNTTGYSVSHHIQQRVILEAKRLLYHSDQSVKEIASALGFDDYPYFSRLFTKATGMTAIAFRHKNRD